MDCVVNRSPSRSRNIRLARCRRNGIVLNVLHHGSNQLHGAIMVSDPYYVIGAFVRFTFDSWKSSEDTRAVRKECRLEGKEEFEIYTFRITWPSSQDKVEFAVGCWKINGENWDNNDGKNYLIHKNLPIYNRHLSSAKLRTTSSVGKEKSQSLTSESGDRLNLKKPKEVVIGDKLDEGSTKEFAIKMYSMVWIFNASVASLNNILHTAYFYRCILPTVACRMLCFSGFIFIIHKLMETEKSSTSLVPLNQNSITGKKDILNSCTEDSKSKNCLSLAKFENDVEESLDFERCFQIQTLNEDEEKDNCFDNIASSTVPFTAHEACEEVSKRSKMKRSGILRVLTSPYRKIKRLFNRIAVA